MKYALDGEVHLFKHFRIAHDERTGGVGWGDLKGSAGSDAVRPGGSRG